MVNIAYKPVWKRILPLAQASVSYGTNVDEASVSLKFFGKARKLAAIVSEECAYCKYEKRKSTMIKRSKFYFCSPKCYKKWKYKGEETIIGD